MNQIIKDCITKVELGKKQQFMNMVVFPISTSVGEVPEYLTLDEALKEKLITITEVSESGSVPQLKVVNNAPIPVIILDGEEIFGAKQNRVVNTTIVIKEKSETTIPVSCTERGRWSSERGKWAAGAEGTRCSDSAIASKLRGIKQAFVSDHLMCSGKYDSDQSAIWNEIRKMHNCSGTLSDTEAMKDIYEAKANDLDAYLNAFDLRPHQNGILVFVNGEVAGLDVIPCESTYKKLHQKLIKGYAMDAILSKSSKSIELPTGIEKSFLAEIIKCSEQKYESVGYGCDYRLEGEKESGSVLVHNDKVVHMAFFLRNR